MDPTISFSSEDYDYIEMKQRGGVYKKVRVAKPELPKKAEVEAKVYGDVKFKENSARGLVRFAVAISHPNPKIHIK